MVDGRQARSGARRGFVFTIAKSRRRIFWPITIWPQNLITVDAMRPGRWFIDTPPSANTGYTTFERHLRVEARRGTALLKAFESAHRFCCTRSATLPVQNLSGIALMGIPSAEARTAGTANRPFSVIPAR